MPRKEKDRTRIFRDPDFPNRFIIEHQGLLGTIEFWSKRIGVSKVTLYRRLDTMPLEKALTHGKLITHETNPHEGAAQKALNISKHFTRAKAPNPEDDGKWFTNDQGELCFRYKNSVKTVREWAALRGIHPRTLQARLFSQKQPIRVAVVKEINHGTGAAYDSLKCRCEVCRAHNSKRQREYQARKRMGSQ